MTTATTVASWPRRELTRSRRPLVGVVTAGLLLLALGTLGDTPDTRATDIEIATWFTQHRTAVFAAVFILTLAVSTLIYFVSVVAELLDGPPRSIILCAGTMVAATVLLINGVIYASLAYVVSADSPAISRAMYEVTLVTTVVIGAQMAAIILCTVTITSLPIWFRAVSAGAACVLVTSGLAVAHRGPMSPDVGQQIVWQLFVLWLGSCGVVLTRRRFEH